MRPRVPCFPAPPRSRRAAGFTLIEVAVVIAIIAALLSTLLVPLATQVQATKIKATDRGMQEIREALIGFAVTRGRLPCPDHDFDGREDLDATNTFCEDPAAVGAVDIDGFLPYVTLGVPASDAWGRLFLYQVTQEFTRPVVQGAAPAPLNNQLDLQDQGNIVINTRTDDPTTAPPAVETRFVRAVGALVPAVVVSLGSNGYGGFSVTQAPPIPIADPDPTVDDERRNRDGDNIFFSRTLTPLSSNCDDTNEANPFCEFDDRVTWISSSVLFNRMVTAGVLP